VNYYSDFGWNAFPGIDMGYNVNNQIRLYANVGTSYRVPTFYDQYYSSPREQGNPDLKPEEALTYELGIRYIKNGISIEGNYFNRDASQLIDWVLNPVDSIYHARNFQNVTTQGFELAVNINFNELIHPGFWLTNIDLSYNYLDQNIDEVEDIQSRYALEHVRNQFVLGIDHKIIGKLKNSFRARYVDRIEQDSYILLDDRIFYEHSDKFTAFVEAVNLTDQKYTEVMTQMPGRWYRAGITLDVGF
jgi:vitamin B12 transporter